MNRILLSWITAMPLRKSPNQHCICMLAGFEVVCHDLAQVPPLIAWSMMLGAIVLNGIALPIAKSKAGDWYAASAPLHTPA